MAEATALSEVERRFLEELGARGVRFLVVGMSAAIIQGARGATEDIDLWFERLDDPGIAAAARAVGGIYVPGGWGGRGPQLGGALGDRFDVVLHVSGARPFADEERDATTAELDGVTLRLLPLHRILASKRAAARPKDLAQIPILEATLAALGEPGR